MVTKYLPALPTPISPTGIRRREARSSAAEHNRDGYRRQRRPSLLHERRLFHLRDRREYFQYRGTAHSLTYSPMCSGNRAYVVVITLPYRVEFARHFMSRSLHPSRSCIVFTNCSSSLSHPVSLDS